MRFDVAFAEMVAVARRYARRSSEAEDIVQEILVAAVVAGRSDFTLSENRRWIAGAIRRRAAFDARSAARRRSREARWQAEREHNDAPQAADIAAILIGMPKSLRVVAALALSGHSRSEIAYLLGLNDAALRQRIRALKKLLERNGMTMPAAMAGLNLDLAYGAIRDALLPALLRHRGVFASHDPDGHLFIVTRSH